MRTLIMITIGMAFMARRVEAGPYFGDSGEFLRSTEERGDQWVREQEEARWRAEQRQEWIREQARANEEEEE